MRRQTQTRDGFTLVEVVIASALSLMVVGITLGLFVSVQGSWREMDLRLGVDQEVNLAMSHMVYGVGDRLGLRCASQAACTAQGGDAWTLVYQTGGLPPQTNSFTYSAAAKTLVFNPGEQTVCRDLSFAWAGVQSGGVVVTLRVDRTEGRFRAQRELGTELSFRNL